MGMTDLQPYFMQIIGHNSMNVHLNPTKLRSAVMSPLSVPNFCLIRAHSRVLMQISKVQNKEEKNEEIKRNFGRLYLRNVWSDFLQICYVDSPTWPALL